MPRKMNTWSGFTRTQCKVEIKSLNCRVTGLSKKIQTTFHENNFRYKNGSFKNPRWL